MGKETLRLLSFSVSIVFLVGCAAQLTTEGRLVRQIEPDWANECKFIGAVEAYSDVGNDTMGALNTLRNQVAVLGGNAFVLTRASSLVYVTLVRGVAYNCVEN